MQADPLLPKALKSTLCASLRRFRVAYGPSGGRFRRLHRGNRGPKARTLSPRTARLGRGALRFGLGFRRAGTRFLLAATGDRCVAPRGFGHVGTAASEQILQPHGADRGPKPGNRTRHEIEPKLRIAGAWTATVARIRIRAACKPSERFTIVYKDPHVGVCKDSHTYTGAYKHACTYKCTRTHART